MARPWGVLKAKKVLGRAMRRFQAKRQYASYMGMRRKIVRFGAMTRPGEPSFTETYAGPQIGANAGGVFNARISDIPQVAQYAQLYKQYRINWIKVMLIPAYGYDSADANAALYNNANAVPYVGASRITYAINDSPAMAAPANEALVLQDNGAKIKYIRGKWSASFKPVPDVAVQSIAAGNPIATRLKYRQWFNFDTVTTGNNPLHYGISYWITQALGPGATAVYSVFYKVNFSLRDPQ